MVKLVRDKSSERAVERAFKTKPKVRVFNRLKRSYFVDSTSNPEKAYFVQFTVDGNGGRYAECSCPAGKHDQICVHAVSAYAVHCGLMKSFHDVEKAKGAAK